MAGQSTNVAAAGLPATKKAKIGIFVDRQQIYDLDEIYQYAASRYAVRLFDGGGPESVQRLLEWSDICWFEGLGSLLIVASHLPRVCANIVRLNKQEIQSELARNVCWQNVDVLITDEPETARNFVPRIDEQTRIISLIDDDERDVGSASKISRFFCEFENTSLRRSKTGHKIQHELASFCRNKGIHIGRRPSEILPAALHVDVPTEASDAAARTLRLPLESRSVEYVVVSEGFEVFEDVQAACCECMRVLQDGGNLVFSLLCSSREPAIDASRAGGVPGRKLGPNLLLAALSATSDYEILYLEEATRSDEAGFSLVVRKLNRELPVAKVVVECHAAVGDVICAEPAVRALKRQLGTEVALVLRVSHPELFRNHPDVSRCESTLLPSQCRGWERKFELSIKPTKANRRCHLVDRAAEQMGVGLDDRLVRLYLDRWDQKMLEKFNLPETGGPRVAISPYVNWPSRLWDGAKWAQLCQLLTERLNATIIQLGAAGTYKARVGIDLVGRTSVREAAAVLSKCDVLVSVDTGLAHLAAAVGTPTVGIFGPVYPEMRMHPRGGRAVIAADAECRGCFHWYEGDVLKCPKGHHECMRLISAEAVLNAVCRVLGRGEAPMHN